MPSMTSHDVPRVTHAEKLLNGVLVTFEDGVSILFSPEQLLESLRREEESKLSRQRVASNDRISFLRRLLN